MALIRILFFIFVVFFNFLFADQDLAVVGSKTITLDEFNKKYDEIKGQVVNPPSPSVFLEDLVRYEIGIQEAEKNNLRHSPLVKEQIRQVLYKAQVESAIGKTVSQINVSDSEMESYYKKNPDIRTSHILISFKIGATNQEKNEAQKRAREILQEVKSSKRDFSQLVKIYSDDNLTRDLGGDIGYQNRVTLVPSYYEMALKMKEGEISPLVESRYGYHIIKKHETRSFKTSDKSQIRAAVFDFKRKQIFDKYFLKLKGGYSIKLNTSILDKMR